MKTVPQTSYKGMMSLRRSMSLPEGYCADSLNSDLGSSSVASPLKGYSVFGHQTNKNQATIRKYTYTKGDGTSILLQVRDNGTNYILEYLNTEDTRNVDSGEWSILEIGLTRSRVLLDGTTKKADFGFTFFNDTGTDQMVYGNAIEGMRIWKGAVASVKSTTVNSVVINGTATIAQRGFSATGSIIINGNTYAYSGISGTTFTVTTDPTAEAAYSGIAIVPDTSTLSAKDKGSIFLTNLARMFIAGMTATPNQVTYSKVGDITSYTGSNPDDGGFEDFPDMNGAITALSYIDNWILVFSERRIVAFKFDYPSSTTRTVIRKVIADEGCPNQKAIRKVGDRIFYITPNGGIKSITQIASADVFNVNDLTEAIRPTLEDFVWTDSSLEYCTKRRIMVAAGKSDNTVSANNMAINLFFTIDENNQQSINLGMMDWFIGDMAIYDGEIHFGGSLDSQDMLAFDGWSKNGAPYKWSRTERTELFSNAWEKKKMPYFSVRGAIEAGTTLKITFKYNINGSLSTQNAEIKGTDTRFVMQSSLNTLGGFSLGTEPLGSTVDDIGDLYPFDVTFPLPEIYFKDFQVVFNTEGAGQRVMIDTHAYWVEDAGQEVTYDEIKEMGDTPDPIPTKT